MLVLDALTQVERFVEVFTSVYALVLIVYVLLSWFRLPSSLGTMQRFLYDVCEPYLRLWRRLPLQFGGFDLSPMVAIFAVYFIGRLINTVLGQLH